MSSHGNDVKLMLEGGIESMTLDSEQEKGDGVGDSGQPQRRRTITPISSVHDAISRLQQSRPWAMGSGSQFNTDTLNREAKAHTMEYKFDDFPIETGRKERAMAGTKNVTIKLAPTFEKNSFFVDPSTFHIYSCADMTIESRLVALGFQRAAVTHLTGPGDLLQLPKLSTASSMTEEEILEAVPPTVLTLPHGQQPHLWKPNGKTTAENVVHAFEIKVYDSEKKLSFSPYRLWTKEARDRFGTKVTSMLTKYCQIYYTVRHLKKDLNPATINESMKELINLAVKDIKRQKIDEPDWFQIACSIH
jgi:hypothetical protein